MVPSKSELHIALFIPTLGGGGAERVFVQLANGLSLKVGRVDLLVASGGHYQQFVSKRVNVVNFEKSRTLATMFGLRKYMMESRPDVMLSTLSDANVVILLAGLLAQWSPPIAIRETVMISENLKVALKTKVLSFMAELLYPRADAVVSLSKGVAVDLERKIGNLKHPVKVIYNPGPSEQELSLGGQASDIFLESKKNGPVFVAVGRLNDQKDYPTLIKAFVRIRERIKSTLWILGEGEKRHSLEELIRALGLQNDVFMPGFVDNPYPYLRAADVFVMSSKYEGGPSSMLQAMACGRKIVSTDCASGPAEFLEDGKQGYLVPVGDVDAFANAVLRSLKEPLSLSSRQKSMQRFDPQYIVDEYLNFLYNVATSNQRMA